MYNNKLSNSVDIKYGVPQGSILEPLLFLVFINDVVNSSKLLNFSMYDDDKTAFMCDYNSALLIQKSE